MTLTTTTTTVTTVTATATATTTMATTTTTLASIGLFPTANNFINRIRTKQQRDRLILAGVVALCVLFCVWWVFGWRR